MKEKLLWAAEHWFLLPFAAFLFMAVLSLAGVKPAPDPGRFYDERPYTGEGLVWQQTPSSSCFSAVGYDDDHEMLALIFRDNQSAAYVYSEIWQSIYQELMAADSLGNYYNDNIKGQFPCERKDGIEGTYFEP